jgi:hypothetical protein
MEEEGGEKRASRCFQCCGTLVLLFFVVIAVCGATQTTIFDKMKGGPLSKTDFIIGSVCILVGVCIFFVVANLVWPDEDEEDYDDDDDEDDDDDDDDDDDEKLAEVQLDAVSHASVAI